MWGFFCLLMFQLFVSVQINWWQNLSRGYPWYCCGGWNRSELWRGLLWPWRLRVQYMWRVCALAVYSRFVLLTVTGCFFCPPHLSLSLSHKYKWFQFLAFQNDMTVLKQNFTLCKPLWRVDWTTMRVLIQGKIRGTLLLAHSAVRLGKQDSERLNSS